MELCILGDLRVVAAGRLLELGPPKQRLVFAALAVDVGRSVPIEALVDRVWDDAPPADARGVLYTYLTRIRRILVAAQSAETVPITVGRSQTGYLLDVDPDRVDLYRLRRLAEQAQGLAADHPDRAALLREAVELWRGDPLDGLPGAWAARVRESLCQQLVRVLLDWADSEIGQGRPGQVVDRLTVALERSPLIEPLAVSLMRALYFNGRRAEALDLYARTRVTLADELGIDPGTDLQDVHREILRGTLRAPRVAATPVEAPRVAQPAVAVPARVEAQPEPAHHAPTGPGCQLPADLPDHVGCEPEISCALSVLQPADGRLKGNAAPVVILSGPGGVGKTALSIRLAYLLRHSYPDGQIFVALAGRGGDSGEALDRVLRALGATNIQQLPTLEDKLGQYRAMLSGRRFLIVLDSAVSAEEVRPLAPGGPGSALIVSSRALLTTIPGAEQIEVPLLDRADSVVLLERIVGPGRVAAEPEATAALVEMCAGLPLALRIVGARIAARPHRRIARLAERMRDERARLDEMTADGLAVRVSVAVGYQALDPPARRAFRLLGFLGVPSFAEWLVAALVGGSMDDAEELLEQLADARLVTAVPDPTHRLLRYHMHDLVRLFARERAVEEDSDGALRAAVARVLVTATELGERLNQRLPYAVPPLYRQTPLPVDVLTIPLPADHQLPGWLEVEAPTLIVAVERAAELGMDVAACALADALVYASFAVRNDFVGWGRTHAAASAAARAAGNAVGEAVIECGIGLLRYKEDRFAEAERNFRTAIDLFGAAGHEHGSAAARSGLGTVLREVGRHREAVPLLTTAAEVLGRLGGENAAAHATYGIGCCLRELGDDEAALSWIGRAVDTYRSLGHARGEAIAARGIGLVHRARGELADAERWCARGHDLIVASGDELLACYTEQALAKVWIRQGRMSRAQEPLERVLETCRRLHDRFGVALVQRTIGELHLAAGRPDTALENLRLAHGGWIELHHDLGAARTLRDLGAAYAALGDVASTHQAWETAAATFRRLGTREAGEAPGWHERWGCGCDAPTPVGVAVSVAHPA
ncbi:AfsR/SARP family transcriptional regulator [Micromonospora lupini]|uniref:Transcriptional regulator, SARP family n=1 Tax=Micromonospora lupini str. Lupac 08 TaxID=1150864 RepID=I0KZH3_9ACTN|nr:BTAD domain-containing putative transcriptional regulator [Micromonospora lupini]CCH16970.1 Transcriptional regulator, SARP family [Micromonospora lupini str. Lupac 08]